MIYLISLCELAAVTALFFGLARGRFLSFGIAQRLLKVLVGVPLFLIGLAHLLMPAMIAQMIPPVVPARTKLVIWIGIAELFGSAGVFLQETERSASLCVALLMIAIFPANIYAAGQTVLGLHMPSSVPVSVLIQGVYILLVLIAGWGWPVFRR